MGSECCTNQSAIVTSKEGTNSVLSNSPRESAAAQSRLNRRDVVPTPRARSKAHQMQSLQPHAHANKGKVKTGESIKGLESAPLGGVAAAISMRPIHKSESEQPQTSHAHQVLEFATHAADMRAPKCKLEERQEKSAMASEVPKPSPPESIPNIESAEDNKEDMLLSVEPSVERPAKQPAEEPARRIRADSDIPMERIHETLSFRKENPSLHMLTGGLWPQVTTINFKVEAEHCKRECTDFLEEKYVILNHVDCGAFGEVKKIREYATGAFRALKIINKNKCQKTKSSNDEIAILKQLVGHP